MSFCQCCYTYLIYYSMPRNICVVSFLYPITMCKCNYSSFLTIDPPPPTISFLSFKPYFPFVPLVEFINQPHPLLAICGTVVVCTPPFYMVDCCMFCFVLLLLVVLSTSCYELTSYHICMMLPQDIYVSLHITNSTPCYQFCKLMQCCLLGRFSGQFTLGNSNQL